jgi:hypothetical protein
MKHEIIFIIRFKERKKLSIKDLEKLHFQKKKLLRPYICTMYIPELTNFSYELQ